MKFRSESALAVRGKEQWSPRQSLLVFARRLISFPKSSKQNLSGAQLLVAKEMAHRAAICQHVQPLTFGAKAPAYRLGERITAGEASPPRRQTSLKERQQSGQRHDPPL